MSALASRRDEDREVVIELDRALRDIIQRCGPERNRPVKILDADYDRSMLNMVPVSQLSNSDWETR